MMYVSHIHLFCLVFRLWLFVSLRYFALLHFVYMFVCCKLLSVLGTGLLDIRQSFLLFSCSWGGGSLSGLHIS